MCMAVMSCVYIFYRLAAYLYPANYIGAVLNCKTVFLLIKDAATAKNLTGKVVNTKGVGIFSPASPGLPFLFKSTTEVSPLLDESVTFTRLIKLAEPISALALAVLR